MVNPTPGWMSRRTLLLGRRQPLVTAQVGVPVPFSNAIVPLQVPEPYTTSGRLLFASGSTSNVEANTPIDLARFQQDLEALTPGNRFVAFPRRQRPN